MDEPSSGREAEMRGRAVAAMIYLMILSVIAKVAGHDDIGLLCFIAVFVIYGMAEEKPK